MIIALMACTLDDRTASRRDVPAGQPGWQLLPILPHWAAEPSAAGLPIGFLGVIAP